AVDGQDFLGHQVADLAINVVDPIEGGFDEPQIAKSAALEGIFNQLQSAGPRGRQRFQQRLENAGAGLRRRDAEISRFDRLQFARGARLALRVENGINERGELEQCGSGGLLLTFNDIFNCLRRFGKDGRFRPRLFERSNELLEAKSPPATTLPAMESRRIS